MKKLASPPIDITGLTSALLRVPVKKRGGEMRFQVEINQAQTKVNGKLVLELYMPRAKAPYLIWATTMQSKEA